MIDSSGLILRAITSLRVLPGDRFAEHLESVGSSGARRKVNSTLRQASRPLRVRGATDGSRPLTKRPQTAPPKRATYGRVPPPEPSEGREETIPR